MVVKSDDMIYLDHNATTSVHPEALEAMLPFLRGAYGNPSSTHALGRQAAEAVTAARAQVAKLIGAQPDEIVFTSGGTEANNLAIRGVAARARADRRRIVTSAVEHPATVQPLDALREEGWQITTVPVASSGHLVPAEVEAVLGRDVALVTVMLAQNETGAVQPVREVAAASRAVGAIVHTDAAQAVGKIPVDVNELGVDLLSLAGHKCYAPKGVGALYVRAGTDVAPVLRGAGQERGLRPGTENVAGVVGLGAACAALHTDLVAEAGRLAHLRDDLWDRLSATVPGIVRLTPTVDTVPNTLLVVFPRVTGWDLLDRAPQVAAATGSACHSGAHSASAAVLAMGLDPFSSIGTVRLSLGRETTATHVTEAATALARAFGELTG